MEHITSSCLFGRKGGASITLLKNLESIALQDAVKQKYELQHILSVKQKQAQEVLYQMINMAPDTATRKVWIKLKRKVQKQTTILEYIDTKTLPQELSRALIAYQDALVANQKQVVEYKELFYEELHQNIVEIGKISKLPFLLNGLLFSSHLVKEQLHKYNFEQQQLNKKDRKLISTLLKYITRSATKTTPFSSFNTIQRFDAVSASDATSDVQINNLFFYYIKKELLNYRPFKDSLPITINPSIEKRETAYHYFINQENNESFKKINHSEILNYISNLFLDRSFTYIELIEHISKVTESTNSTTAGFVDQLTDQGFIVLNYPVHQNDKRWMDTLVHYIITDVTFDKDTFLKELKTLLQDCQSTVLSLNQTSDLSERETYILESYNQIHLFFSKHKLSEAFIKKVKAQDLYYEDCFETVAHPLTTSSQKELAIELNQWYNWVNCISYKKGLHYFLMQQSGLKEGDKLPLLHFYEQYYLRLHTQFSLDREELKVFTDKMLAVQQECLQCVNQQSIDLKTIKSLASESKINPSFGAYIQPVGNNADSFVFNGFTRGNNQIDARFLNGVKANGIAAIKEELKQKYPNCTLVELKDASLHNINNFPAITDHAISMDLNTISGSYSSVGIHELYVQIVENQLQIIDQNNRPVKLVNSSLEGLNRRSKLMQFLDVFDPVDTMGYGTFLSQIKQLYRKQAMEQKVVIAPRIQFGNKITIQRKTWFVQKEELQKILVHQPEELHNNYYQLQQWIKQHYLPSEVFIKIGDRNLTNSEDDHYKPQYINWNSPASVLLFMNLINKAQDIIEISELLPDKQAVMNSNHGCVQELLFTIN